MVFSFDSEGILATAEAAFVHAEDVDLFWNVLPAVQRVPDEPQWYFSPAVGYFVPFRFAFNKEGLPAGWLWIESIGWIFCQGSDFDSATLWSPDYGWFISHSAYFPLAVLPEEGTVVSLVRQRR
ncbi:MAG: hypothetical protein LR015_08785 [Verrucomicrobia bacterium]|nr:hypothetical protein [Verrucomicrobiota bacterium]